MNGSLVTARDSPPTLFDPILSSISGDEGRDEGHDEHEQSDEASGDPEDHDGVREADRDDGHEGGDDE